MRRIFRRIAAALMSGMLLIGGRQGGLFGVQAEAEEIGADEGAAVDPRVEAAMLWASGIASDDAHGYSQVNRWGPDYDCSSFLITAFHNGGFDIPVGYGNTGTMKASFMSAGFRWIGWAELGGSSGIRRGDILMAPGHCELYMGNGRNVAAHSDYDGIPGDGNGKEIRIGNYYTYGGGWSGVLRYDGEGGGAPSAGSGIQAEGTGSGGSAGQAQGSAADEKSAGSAAEGSTEQEKDPVESTRGTEAGALSGSTASGSGSGTGAPPAPAQAAPGTGDAAASASAPRATYMISLRAAPKSFRVVYQAREEAAGYQVSYSTSETFKGAKTKATKKTDLTFSGLKSGKAYYVRVRTYKKSGGAKTYSAWSAVKNITPW